MDYNNSYETTYAVSDTRVSSVMKRVYLIMTVGLALTGVLAYVCGNSFGYLQWFANNSWAFWVMAIGELAIVFGVSAGINKISTATATAARGSRAAFTPNTGKRLRTKHSRNQTGSSIRP